MIVADESRTLELKKTTGELKDGMHTACAFLNTEGGCNFFDLLDAGMVFLFKLGSN
ncbi:MAG: hypothetical protein SPH56_06185 [Prevotella sp.]|nr:hypothetical protein [Prevotella sp.]